jgi:hypothetical protein
MPETIQQFYERFSPLMIYSTNRKTLRYLLERTTGWIMWNGRMYDIKHSHLGVGVYKVWGELQK